MIKLTIDIAFKKCCRLSVCLQNSYIDKVTKQLLLLVQLLAHEVIAELKQLRMQFAAT